MSEATTAVCGRLSRQRLACIIMTTGSILLGFALLIVTILYLSQPFLAPTRGERKISKIQKLTNQKEVLLEQLQSLDFEFETGKVPEDIYQLQRAALLAEASDTLRQLDGLNGVVSSSAAIDDEIEAVIAQVSSEDQIEAAIAQLTAVEPAKPVKGKSVFCTQCGQPVDSADRFCSSCGKKIKA